MKVYLNLTEAGNSFSGIGVFEKEISMRLCRYSDLQIIGGVNILRNYDSQLYKEFTFPIVRSRIPSRLIFNNTSSLKRKWPLISFNTIMNVHCESFIFFSNRLPQMQVNGKIICCIHDLIPMKAEMEDPNIKINFINNITDVINRASLIITVSKNSMNDLVGEFNINPANIAIVPNGVDFNKFNMRKKQNEYDEVRKKYSLPKKYFLYFGSLRKHKNVENILRSYARLPVNIREEYNLVITNGDNNETVKELSCLLGIKNNVCFTPAIEENDKVAIYQMAEIKIFVSLYEGFGIPVIEAMAAGVPVITSNTSSLKEVSGNAALLVNPNEIDEIRDAIMKLISDVEYKNKLIKRGYVNAKKYSWENAAMLMHEAIVSLSKN